MAAIPLPPRQSWPSAIVDLAIIASVLFLALNKDKVDGHAYLVLSQIAMVRFGVAVHKSRSGDGGEGGGGSSGQYRQVRVPDETPKRDDSTFVRRGSLVPSSAVFGVVLAITVVMMVAR